tara:strand:- start:184 stop:414 length:231 start_codon:yes stop_codon:yes gene_type:complete
MKLQDVLQELNEIGGGVKDWLRDFVVSYKKLDPSLRNADSKIILKHMPMNKLMKLYRRNHDPAKAARLFVRQGVRR